MKYMPSITNEELQAMSDIPISPCPCCEQAFTLDNSGWLHGEKEHADGDWDETIAFGCPTCNAVGPASLNRIEAMWGWNVLVGASEEMRKLYKNL